MRVVTDHHGRMAACSTISAAGLSFATCERENNESAQSYSPKQANLLALLACGRRCDGPPRIGPGGGEWACRGDAMRLPDTICNLKVDFDRDRNPTLWLRHGGSRSPVNTSGAPLRAPKFCPALLQRRNATLGLTAATSGGPSRRRRELDTTSQARGRQPSECAHLGSCLLPDTRDARRMSVRASSVLLG